MRFKNARFLKSITKKLPGAHLEICRNGLASWDYVAKSESKLEGPLTHGSPPPAQLNQKGEKSKRNKMLIEKGATQAALDGDIPLKDVIKIDQAI
jgi:hypothetical protein